MPYGAGLLVCKLSLLRSARQRLHQSAREKGSVNITVIEWKVLMS